MKMSKNVHQFNHLNACNKEKEHQIFGKTSKRL